LHEYRVLSFFPRYFHQEKSEKSDKKRKHDDTAPAVVEEHDGKKARTTFGATLMDNDENAGEQWVGETPQAAVEKGQPELHVDNFALDRKIKEVLLEKKIEVLFPIQAMCLPPALAGKDLVGRARTGCGKTLAFVLPVVQLLLTTPPRGGFGRKPSVIVLAPTRELAKQVHEDFELIGRAANLKTVCVYGGSPMGPQDLALRRGVDVVVGTPGRVKDHLDRKSLSLSNLRFRILDECDEMLNMGFADDVEYILAHESAGTDGGEDGKPIQTLLFSATMPSWVRQMASKYLQATNQGYVDLVGDSKMKASTSVRHLLLPCLWTQVTSLVTDLVKCYGCQGRSIVFCDTKKDVDELAQALTGARPLHGDIAQASREQTLKGFKAGTFNVLVATDVAARGLDITGVELVIQTGPPKEHETYIHRSGRTGRANSTGVSVLLVTRSKEYMVQLIERRAGLKFERIGAPQPEDMSRIAAERCVEAIEEVNKDLIPMFKSSAEKLLKDFKDLTPVEVLALALARITGFTNIKRRSLLSSSDEFTTVQFRSGFKLDRATGAFGFLRRRLGDQAEQVCAQIKAMQLVEDGMGTVFDVPVELVEDLIKDVNQGATGEEAPLFLPAKLPTLQRQIGDNTGMGGGGGGYGGGRGGGGGYGGGRGGYGGGGGRGGGGYGGGRGGGRGFGGRGGGRGGGFGRGRGRG